MGASWQCLAFFANHTPEDDRRSDPRSSSGVSVAQNTRQRIDSTILWRTFCRRTPGNARRHRFLPWMIPTVVRERRGGRKDQTKHQNFALHPAVAHIWRYHPWRGSMPSGAAWTSWAKHTTEYGRCGHPGVYFPKKRQAPSECIDSSLAVVRGRRGDRKDQMAFEHIRRYHPWKESMHSGASWTTFNKMCTRG